MFMTILFIIKIPGTINNVYIFFKLKNHLLFVTANKRKKYQNLSFRVIYAISP